MLRICLLFMFFVNFIFAAVDINIASKKELMSLQGIGAKKADAIIEYRSKTKFNSIEDIKKVKGISEKAFEKIKGDISVGKTIGK